MVAKVAPELLTEAAQNKSVQEIAAEVGLFGEKTKSILEAAKVANKWEPKRNVLRLLKRGDVVDVGSGIDKVQLGYQYANIPDHPLLQNHYRGPYGMMETFKVESGRITIPYDMEVFTAHDSEGYRIPLTVVPQGKAGDAALLIGGDKPKEPISDLEAYIEKRKAEGVEFDDTWTAAGRAKIREREYREAGITAIETSALFESERALMRERAGEVARQNWSWNSEYHPSRNRSRSLEKPLAKPVGYLPA